MQLSEDQAQDRLSSPSNLANRFGKMQVETLPRTGKKQGSINFPPFIKTSIAIQTHLKTDSQKNIGEAFGMTQANVSAIKTGKNSTDSKEVETVLSSVRDVALAKVMSSIGLITDDKLNACKAKDLSTIASNLSKVAANTFVSKEESGNSINLHIYCPEQKQETSYKVIDV